MEVPEQVGNFRQGIIRYFY